MHSEREKIHIDVKAVFIRNISNHLKENPVRQIQGASEFIDVLRGIGNLSISIATGGWYETAILKLHSANIDISGIPIASSDNHFSRIEIMKIAEEKAKVKKSEYRTYFGDAEWDRKASLELGFNFVLVGDRTNHNQSIPDYSNTYRALEYIGV